MNVDLSKVKLQTGDIVFGAMFVLIFPFCVYVDYFMG